MSNSNQRPNMSRENIPDKIAIESDIELDESYVVAPDNEFEEMGYHTVEVSEENQEAAEVLKSYALNAICEGQLVEAKAHLTKAIMLNPKSALLFASRATCYVKLEQPNDAIRDADVALQMNPELARGHKARGMAMAMLGFWEKAATNLNVALKLDFDEETYMMLKKVEPNANKIRQRNEQLHRESEQRKLELQRQNIEKIVQALSYKVLEKEQRKIELERKKNQPKSQDAETASLLKDGEVIGIHSASELKTKLNAASKTSRLSIIYFTATWCGPCRYVSPVYTSLAGKYPKVVFLKSDIDDARDAAAEYNVSSVPCFFFMKNGKEIDKVVGADKNLLEKKIAQHAG